MTPTNEQIKAEAERRRLEQYKAYGGRLPDVGGSLIDHVIEVTREGWTPEPEEGATPITSHQPMDGHNLITLRLECMKMAVRHFSILDREQAADRLLHYVLNGSVDKA